SASAVSFPMPDDAPVTSATGRFVVIMHSRTQEKPIGFFASPHCKPIGFHPQAQAGNWCRAHVTGCLRAELTDARQHGGTGRMSRQERRESVIPAL
ncbi:hypothetical protein, partial [Streptomyces albicerus]|uniref:hypothetical protein n=1 Tax=Streptomyces albicerus TaxID=2569859 RepID=UPI001CECF4A8